MDLFPIVMDVEKTFDIQLEEEECRALRTVGELHALVARKLQLGSTGPCLSMKTFHLLRQNLIATCSLSREEIRVDSPLNDLLPGSERKAMWERLEHRMGLKLPQLTLPTVIASIMLASAVGAFVAIPIGIISGMSTTAVLLAMLLAWCKHRAMHWLASPLANRIHVGIRTVGDLTTAVLHHNFGTISKQGLAAADHEAWLAIRSIVAENLGVLEVEIMPESRFVEDLGVG